MSYHDKPPDWSNNTGIAVVNPLHEQRKRLTKLENFLKELAEEIESPEIKQKIQKFLLWR